MGASRQDALVRAWRDLVPQLPDSVTPQLVLWNIPAHPDVPAGAARLPARVWTLFDRRSSVAGSRTTSAGCFDPAPGRTTIQRRFSFSESADTRAA